MGDTSPRLGWPIPGENADPYYEALVALIAAIDASAYGPAREDRNIVLGNGGTVAFNASTGALSWSAALELLSAPTGYLWTVPAGAVTLADNQILYAQLVRAPVGSVALAAQVGAQTPSVGGDDSIVLAFRRGTKVYWRNGKALADGESLPLFDTSALTGVIFQKDGVTQGTRGKVNFIGMVTVVDTPVQNRVDVTVPTRGVATETLLSYVPITMARDTDSTVYVVAGHFTFNPASHVLTGTTRSIQVVAMGYCSTPGVTGVVEFADLDGSDVFELTFTAPATSPARLVSTVTLPSAAHRYRVRYKATGSTGPAERFFLDWAGFVVTNTIN